VVTVHAPSQQPFLYQGIMADVLGHPKRKIRVVVPDVGGGFGMKSMFYPDEALVAFAAMQLERPVKWVETRTEAFIADEHGRDQRIEAAVAVDDDGTVRGLGAHTTPAASSARAFGRASSTRPRRGPRRSATTERRSAPESGPTPSGPSGLPGPDGVPR
jgi:CO/xanthine dehydrogenase Mo-binding subunit